MIVLIHKDTRKYWGSIQADDVEGYDEFDKVIIEDDSALGLKFKTLNSPRPIFVGETIADFIEKVVPQAELDQQAQQVIEQQKQAITTELAQLDTIVSREYENTYKFALNLVSLMLITVEELPYWCIKFQETVDRKNELRNLLKGL